jgi:NAD(P)-dependent dehydrogenase (short-subunit alcohol dehydrogenase family)
VPFEVDISNKDSVLRLIAAAQEEGEISMFINAAGVSPSQASIEQILQVDLYGTSLLLEEFGKVIKAGGAGVTISSQSGYRMPALTADEDLLLATTPIEELLALDMLQPGNIKDTLHAYQMAKRANGKRVMAEAVKWGERGARVNAISPGIIITPLALDEINGPRGDFYKNMFAKSPAGRPGIADEVANVAELLLSNAGAFITGSDFLIDGGATASYFYGPLQPEKK